MCQYDLYGADGPSARAIATFVAGFEGGPTIRLAEPSATLEVNGPDPAKVRGIADEAMDRAQRGVETPVPVVDSEPAVSKTTEPEREPVTTPARPSPAPTPTPAPSPSRWSRFINNQWVVGLAVTVIGSLIVALIIAKAS